MSEVEGDARFASTLEDCIRRVRRGEALERCLADCPAEYREELARLVPLGERVSLLRRDPSPEFQARLEQQLLARVDETRRVRRGGLTARIGRLFVANPVLRVAAILLVVVVLLGGGLGADQAAADSLPDSPLYRIKAVREQVQLALARTPEAQVDVHAAQIQERRKELESALRSGKPRQQVVEALAIRVGRSTEQMVDRALERAASGNRQPALRALLAIRTMVGYLDRLDDRASGEIRPTLQRLRAFLTEQGRRLVEDFPRGPAGRGALRMPFEVVR